MRQTKVSVRGQTVIPHEIREELGIKPNTKIDWSTRNGVIIAIPLPDDPIAASLGALAGRGYTMKNFLEDRNKERELERRQDAREETHIRHTMRRRKE